MTTSPKPTKDEAIRTALDSAQDFINSVHYGKWAGHGGLRNEVQQKIIAAREALAQPAADDKAVERAGLLAKFEQCVGRVARLHERYTGKAMPDNVYSVFAAMRDETIPALRAALLAADDKAGGEVCPLCKKSAGGLFRALVDGDELDTAHCGCLYTSPQPQAERPAERAGLTDEMGAEELALFKSTVDDFDDCGETSTPDATLMDWARRGYLDCVRFETTEKAHKMLATLPDDSGITAKDQS